MRAATFAFALVLVALGVTGFIVRDYEPLWLPPDGLPAVLVILCNVVSIASGVGLLWRHTSALAARVLLGYLVVWSLTFRLYDLVTSPGEFGAWDGLAEAAVPIAGAWVLYTRLATDWDRRYFRRIAGDTGVRIARVLYGLALIPFGLAHFLYLDRTVSMVPSWLPAHLVLACCTGAAFIAAGVAVVVGICARWAAALSALEIGLVTVLVWIPIMSERSLDPFEWIEVGVSVALTAAGWIVADSYRGEVLILSSVNT
jgi:uncharacterized membrane protein